MPKKLVNLVQVRKGPKTLQPLEAIKLMKKSGPRFLAIPRNRNELVQDQRRWYFIRSSKGERMGTVSVHPVTAEIGGFSVLSNHRSLATAKSVLGSAERILRRLGHKRAVIRVKSSSARTINSLQYLGWITVRTVTKEKYGVKAKLIELEKKL